MGKTIVSSILVMFFLGVFGVSSAAAGHDQSNSESATPVGHDNGAVMEDDPAMAAIPPAEQPAVLPDQGKQPPEEEPAMATIPEK